MHKTAVLVTAVGLIFVFFSLPVAGVDLLIDAVGFLLVFNGLRVLKYLQPAFGFVAPVCLVLVPLAAVQLFFTGTFGSIVCWLRAAVECLLYVLMARGFFAAGRQRHQRACVAAAVLLGTQAALRPVQLMNAHSAESLILAIVSIMLQIGVLATLGWVALTTAEPTGE